MTNMFNNRANIQSLSGKLQQLATNHFLYKQENDGSIKRISAEDICGVLVLTKDGRHIVDLDKYSRAPQYRDYTMKDYELFKDKTITHSIYKAGVPCELKIEAWNESCVLLTGNLWTPYRTLRKDFTAVCTNSTDCVLGVRLPDRTDEVDSSADDDIADKTTRGVDGTTAEWDISEVPPAIRELVEKSAEIAAHHAEGQA